MRTARQMSPRRLTVVSLLIGGVLWEAVARIMATPELLPPPSAVAVTFWEMLVLGDIWRAVRDSSTRVLVGYLIGAVGGIVTGLLLGGVRVADAYGRSRIRVLKGHSAYCASAAGRHLVGYWGSFQIRRNSLPRLDRRGHKHSHWCARGSAVAVTRGILPGLVAARDLRKGHPSLVRAVHPIGDAQRYRLCFCCTCLRRTDCGQ